MKELRDDLTYGEMREFVEGTERRLYVYSDGLKSDSSDVFPESFYKQPPFGTFGYFPAQRESCLSGAWGYYAEPGSGYCGYRRQGTTDHYVAFEPGLPTDVDENGWPTWKGAD